jgi:hypothetical protein
MHFLECIDCIMRLLASFDMFSFAVTATAVHTPLLVLLPKLAELPENE